ARFIVHRLMGRVSGAVDARARVLNEPQRPMLDRLLAADPTFTCDGWHSHDDTYSPLTRSGSGR
ncbi:MAG: hypothetical protein AB7R77_27850, partial [Ilumatobacteraceae bacterium]